MSKHRSTQIAYIRRAVPQADYSQGVIYLNVGTKCLVRLVTSIYSLRRHYNGPIAIMDGGSSGGLCPKIANDLGALHIGFSARQMKRHTSYNAKSSLWRHSPFDRTMFIDSDTIVAQPIDEFFSGENPLVLTEFSGWKTNGNKIKGRLEQWRGIEAPWGVGQVIDQAVNNAYYAINTGVLRWDAEIDEFPKFLEDWEGLTNAGAGKCSFTDELAMQLLYVRGIPDTLIVSDIWNASPIYTKSAFDDVRIWHMHGSKHVTREDGRGHQGQEIWWPVFQEVWEKDICGIQSWAANSKDKQLLRSEAWKVLTG